MPIRTYQSTLGNVLVDGIEVCNWLGAYLGISLTWGASGSVVNCLVHGNADSGSNGVSCKDDATGVIANNIIYDVAGTGILGGSGSAGKVYNNTVFNCGVGIYTYGFSVITVNNIVFNCGACFSGNYNAGDDYNLSSDATAPGSNSLINQASNPFVDSASGNFHLIDGSPPIGAGIGHDADSNVPQFDIDGDGRSGSTTDIGADLFVASGQSVMGMGLVSGSPVLGLAAVSQIFNMAGVGLVSGPPVLGQGAITQAQGVSGVGLVSGSPVLGLAAVSQVFNVAGVGLVSGPPVLGLAFVMQGVNPSLPPTGRIIKVPYEDRIIKVPYEDRIIKL